MVYENNKYNCQDFRANPRTEYVLYHNKNSYGTKTREGRTDDYIITPSSHNDRPQFDLLKRIGRFIYNTFIYFALKILLFY